MSQRGRALGVFALSMTTFYFVYLAFVKTAFGQRIEAEILLQSDFSVDPLLPLAAVQPWIIIAVLAAFTVVIWLKTNIFKAISIWFIAGLSMATAQIIKIILPRVSLIDAGEPGVQMENTLPSGHLNVFVTLILIFVLILSKRLWRVSFWLAILVLAVVTWQLLDYGWHRPSDLIASVSLTVGVFAFLAMINPNILNFTSQPHSRLQKLQNLNFEKFNNIILPILAILVIFFLVFVGFNIYVYSKLLLGLAFGAVFVTTLVFFSLVKPLSPKN